MLKLSWFRVYKYLRCLGINAGDVSQKDELAKARFLASFK